MPAYVIVESKVTDPERYSGYGPLARPSIEQYGGKFIVRGGNPEALEGQWKPSRLVVIAFDSVEQAKRWYDSPEYRAARRQREGATEFFNMVLVEGT
ncbi:MAG: DUF1330 domain-containing protein [Chloroflexi bacterium]|nr:DUF1330 domain-containing protein [Chloroflexota bacterium]